MSIAQNSGKGGKGEDEHDGKTSKGHWSGTPRSLACDLFCTFMETLICVDDINIVGASSATQLSKKQKICHWIRHVAPASSCARPSVQSFGLVYPRHSSLRSKLINPQPHCQFVQVHGCPHSSLTPSLSP